MYFDHTESVDFCLPIQRTVTSIDSLVKPIVVVFEKEIFFNEHAIAVRIIQHLPTRTVQVCMNFCKSSVTASPRCRFVTE